MAEFVQLYILEWKISDEYYLSRALATLSQIDRALAASPEPIPDIEFSFIVADVPDPSHSNHTSWALTKHATDGEIWLMPDFGYWSWPLSVVGAYRQVRAEIAASEEAFENKIRLALWRGAAETNKARADLLTATHGKNWADVAEVHWKNLTAIHDASIPAAISMVDHCAYEFLIHVEGKSYSGRGKYLLNCNSVFIAPEPEWAEPHLHLLESSGDGQNFVQVQRDFSDLEDKVQQLLDDPERSRAIASNSVKKFRDRYLTPAAQACYWRQLMKAWAEVSFDPDPYHYPDGKRRIRGKPFETFMYVKLPCRWLC